MEARSWRFSKGSLRTQGQRRGFTWWPFESMRQGFLAFLRQLGHAQLRDDRNRLLTADAVRDHQKAYSVYFCDPYGHRLEVTTYDYERVREALPAFRA